VAVIGISVVKDEADIIRQTIEHMLKQVDHIIVADNMSSDGTHEVLESLPVELLEDREVAYRQGAKVTALAHAAYDGYGADFVVSFDADEVWRASDPRQTVKEVLERLRPSTMIAEAQWLTHNPNGTTTIERLPKVACRYHPNLVIDQGNHFAHYGKPVERAIGLLKVDHYPWRTPEQALRKIRNGIAAYRAAPDLPEKYGTHWKELARVLETEGEKAVLARLGMLEL
jgi:hypothetical protein